MEDISRTTHDYQKRKKEIEIAWSVLCPVYPPSRDTYIERLVGNVNTVIWSCLELNEKGFEQYLQTPVLFTKIR